MSFASQTHATIARLLETDMDQSIKKFLEIVAMNVKIVESNRMTKAAGQAKAMIYRNTRQVVLESLTLSLSTKLLSRATKEEVNETILHELAHLIDYVIRGTSNHDAHWLFIVKALGGKGHTYHKINTSGLGRKVTRYIYENNEGKRFSLKKSGHYKAMRIPHGYRLVAIHKYKDGVLVEDIPAQYATSAA